MFYIHALSCISPQQTFGETDLSRFIKSDHNELIAKEPVYENIPAGLLRRMGKAVRIGVGAGLPLLQKYKTDGIIMGTSHGGLEDCVKFLVQIIDYEEGRLTPTNFVQSTPNAIAAQLGLMKANLGYNITHTHRGLAFENAILDVAMLLNENPGNSYLLGGIDEISNYNHHIENLGGWYKSSEVSNTDLYADNSPGSIPGEGATMFIVSKNKAGAISELMAVKMLHTHDLEEVISQLQLFLDQNLGSDQTIDLLISGENGDVRFQPFYDQVERFLPPDTGIIRFKHLSGEYPTSTAFALWLGSVMFQLNEIPAHFYKRIPAKKNKVTLIYNHFKGEQHSFMLLKSA